MKRQKAGSVPPVNGGTTGTDTDTYFMRFALKQAELAYADDEVPIGAVVVHNNHIIARGYNQVEKLKDATAHAEMLAVTSAMGTLASKFLNDCDVYITLEPCVMCSGALHLARVRRVVFAAHDPKFGACGSLYNVAADGKLNHRIALISGVLAEESSRLLRSFFTAKRAKP